MKPLGLIDHGRHIGSFILASLLEYFESKIVDSGIDSICLWVSLHELEGLGFILTQFLLGLNMYDCRCVCQSRLGGQIVVAIHVLSHCHYSKVDGRTHCSSLVCRYWRPSDLFLLDLDLLMDEWDIFNRICHSLRGIIASEAGISSHIHSLNSSWRLKFDVSHACFAGGIEHSLIELLLVDCRGQYGLDRVPLRKHL